MRRTVGLVAAAVLALAASRAAASGFNLGWNDCPGGATYALARTFACDTNEGSHTLVGSFVAPAGVVAMTGHSAVIDFQTSGPSLSAWWGLRTSPPMCRVGALGSNFDFTGGPFTCSDYWQGGAVGGSTMDFPVGNRGRLRPQCALALGDLRIGPVLEGVEVYLFKMVIDNRRTVGPEACGGCADEACIVMNTLFITQTPGTAPNLFMMHPASVQHVIWQAWTTVDPRQSCPAVTPVRSRTWGSIKTLYR